MHGDWMAWFYRCFWGANLHHGFHDRRGLGTREAEQKLKELVGQRVGIRGHEQVLEVGFGFGETALWLARSFGCRVTGITISRAECRIARITARLRRLNRQVEFRLLDAAHVSVLPVESFDRVWCLESVEFLSDKAKLLRDCYALLRPGGRVVVCGLMKSDGVTAEDYARYVEPVCRGFAMPPFASREDHERWLTEAGFEEVHGEDLTRQVLATGDRGARVLGRADVRLLRRLAPSGIGTVLDTFAGVFDGYRSGALRYGLVTARTSSILS